MGRNCTLRSRNETDEKTIITEELKEAVDNLSLVRQGKLKARSAKALLDDL